MASPSAVGRVLGSPLGLCPNVVLRAPHHQPVKALLRALHTQKSISGLSSRLTSPPRGSLTLHRIYQSTDATKTGDPEAKTAGGPATGQEDSAAEVSELETKLLEENQELKAKCDDLMDKYRRSIAESDNMRKRLTKQIDDAKIFGIQGFCKDLLAVADVLNKAIGGVSPEILAQESQYLKDMHQGLALTESQLLQVFRRHGLEQDNPVEEKFDPHRHEALFQIPHPDKEPNTVLDVQQVGYTLHGRTIRPAKVGVSKKP
ncbi:grpE protein homolog, mitochondrial-like [Tigriopus californicus]|nr:grpE protein homolog, mitochondrial-like [Tigriopus californicus]